jgi:hypothetical protein
MNPVDNQLNSPSGVSQDPTIEQERENRQASLSLPLLPLDFPSSGIPSDALPSIRLPFRASSNNPFLPEIQATQTTQAAQATQATQAAQAASIQGLGVTASAPESESESVARIETQNPSSSSQR